MPIVDRQPLKASINPNIEVVLPFIRKVFLKHQGLLIIGRCWVTYRGRASSQLQSGERVALFKKDGSILVHRPVGYEPVNWQPPGCIFHVSIVDNILQIKAVRLNPPETVKIFFDKIYLLSVLNLTDDGEFALYASEQDMQKAVLMMPRLVEDGLKPITYEKKVEPGFVDVYCEDDVGRFVVIEIKRKTAGKQAAIQLAKYVVAVRDIVNKDVRGLLVAPSLGKGTQLLLSTLGLEFKALDPKKCAEVLRKTEYKRLQDFFEPHK